MKNRLDLTQHWEIYTQSTCTAYIPLIFRGIIHFNSRYSHVILEIPHNFHITANIHTPKSNKTKNNHKAPKSHLVSQLQTHWTRMAFTQQTWILAFPNSHCVQRLASTLCTLDGLHDLQAGGMNKNKLWPLPFHLWDEINTHWYLEVDFLACAAGKFINV